MKASVHRENLQRALGIVERIAAKNAALPILSNILVCAEKGILHLSATNLEIGVAADVNSKVEGEGRLAVPGRILSDFVKSARGDVVHLTAKQNALTVEIGSYTTTILCFDAAEYPPVPEITGGTTHTVSGGSLRDALVGVIDSIAASDARPELAGALFRFGIEELTVAATDSFRLVEQCCRAVGEAEESIIIPRATVAELVRILGESNEDVRVRIAENQAVFSGAEFTLISRLIDGRYPDYRKVIPERSISRALVRSADLEDAVRAASLFASSISDIRMTCSEKELNVSAKNASKGEATAAAEVNLKGDVFEVSMNYHYLLDGLKSIRDEKVILEFTGKGSPFVLRPSGESRAVYIIMPLRN